MGKIESVLKEYPKMDYQNIEDDIQKIIEKRANGYKNQKTYSALFNCLDLTSLNTTDNEQCISDLVQKVNLLPEQFQEMPQVAAICIYPSFIKIVKEELTESIEIASVSGGFPHAQTFMEVKVAETALCVLEGATEVDCVLSVGELKEKRYDEIVEELQEMKATCRNATLKVILETEALTLDEIRIASILCLESGVDFIKTSTGKMKVGATLEAAYVMLHTIKDYAELRGENKGFKAAGGISTAEEAIKYYSLVDEILGAEWLNNQRLRFGTSKLANSLLSEYYGKQINYF